MKKILRKIVEIVTLKLSKSIIKKYNPIIIGVTGSVGKTSAKDAIYDVLKTKYDVQKSQDNLNSELGLPLALINRKGDVRTDFSYWFTAIKELFSLLKNGGIKPYLVLEMGADKPGDLEKLIKIAKPNVSIVTSVKFSHYEFFKSVNEIRKEKSTIIKYLNEKNTAILNGDDQEVMKMIKKTKAHIMTYGFNKTNQIKAEELQIDCNLDKKNNDLICSSSLKLIYNNNIVPIKTNNIGKPSIYAMLAAAAVGINFGLNLLQITEGLGNFKTPKGRMKAIKGIGNSLIIDDTYNASSPESVMEGLKTIKKIKTRKKIAVIGDILELGTKEKSTHQKIGKKILNYVDIVFTHGKAAKYISQTAKKGNNKKNKLINHFDSKNKLINVLKDILTEDVLVYVKGSQGMRMEKIIKQIIKNKKNARNILARQTKEWLKK